MSYLTATQVELLYVNRAAFTAKNTFTTEVSINDTGSTMGDRASIPPNFFDPAYGIGKSLRIHARGILSSTGTPTYTFTVRLGATGSTTAAIILGTAALTTASGITNKGWELEGDITMRTLGAAGANSTMVGAGMLVSPAGLASPFSYEAWGGAAQPGTVATVDTSITNFINFNVACSASSVSNNIQLLELLVFGLN